MPLSQDQAMAAFNAQAAILRCVTALSPSQEEADRHVNILATLGEAYYQLAELRASVSDLRLDPVDPPILVAACFYCGESITRADVEGNEPAPELADTYAWRRYAALDPSMAYACFGPSPYGGHGVICPDCQGRGIAGCRCDGEGALR